MLETMVPALLNKSVKIKMDILQRFLIKLIFVVNAIIVYVIAVLIQKLHVQFAR
jgi:hypothetical protein